MIVFLQWVISLRSFEIQTATMTMHQFRTAPRKGHLERLKRVYDNLRRLKNAAIWISVNVEDFSTLPVKKLIGQRLSML
jgi:hypothetical protein